MVKRVGRSQFARDLPLTGMLQRDIPVFLGPLKSGFFRGTGPLQLRASSQFRKFDEQLQPNLVRSFLTGSYQGISEDGSFPK